MRPELVLIDTSAWIFALRKSPLVLIRNRIEELLKADLVATTEMVKFELLGGTRTKLEFQIVEQGKKERQKPNSLSDKL